mgnify:FL=1
MLFSALWLKENYKFAFRFLVSVLGIFLANLIYSKYEAVMLITNPEKLFIPLYIYTAIILVFVVWTCMALKSVLSWQKLQELEKLQNSFKDKSASYKDFEDVNKHPNLTSRVKSLLEKD